MSRFFKSVKEQAMREHTMFPQMKCGPIRGRCHDDGVTVETTDGVTVNLPINSTVDMRVDRSLLQQGVPVSVDNKVVGHLVQESHGARRSARTMRLVAVDQARYPTGAHFRLRGWGNVSLEADSGRLAGFRGLTLRAWAHPEVSCELAAIFMAVSIGLQEPLRSAPAWLPDPR
jgi:hypothetical protein